MKGVKLPQDMKGLPCDVDGCDGDADVITEEGKVCIDCWERKNNGNQGRV